MTMWGVLRLPAGVDAAAHAGDGAVAAAVAQHLDGLVAVAEGTSVAGVLALLPAAVSRIVELDPRTATDPAAADVLATLLAAADVVGDGVHAAATMAGPLADALKRVDGDVIVEGFARDGMLVPTVPAVIDRSALTAAAGDGGTGDAVALLLAAGHSVRVVPVDGAPLTVRAEHRS